MSRVERGRKQRSEEKGIKDSANDAGIWACGGWTFLRESEMIKKVAALGSRRQMRMSNRETSGLIKLNS